MKKVIPMILYSIAVLLTIGFAVSLYSDYTVYYPWGSAPFYVYVLGRFAEFMVAAIGCFLLGVVFRKKK